MNISNILATTVVAFSAISGSAHAGGVGGDLINKIVPGLGTALDEINHRMGNPVDHAAAAVLDVYVPGAGRALETGWALQRSGR